MPPLVEFCESLLVNGSGDLALQTCKITDQLSGRLMGIRADITPQTARTLVTLAGTDAGDAAAGIDGELGTPCSCCSRWLLPAGQGWFCTVRVPAASVQR